MEKMLFSGNHACHSFSCCVICHRYQASTVLLVEERVNYWEVPLLQESLTNANHICVQSMWPGRFSLAGLWGTWVCDNPLCQHSTTKALNSDKQGIRNLVMDNVGGIYSELMKWVKLACVASCQESLGYSWVTQIHCFLMVVAAHPGLNIHGEDSRPWMVPFPLAQFGQIELAE